MTAPHLTITSAPVAYVGSGEIARLGETVAATGAQAVLIVTDGGLAATAVIGTVRAAIESAGLPVAIFSGVHANPTIDDLAAGAEVAGEMLAAAGQLALVAVGGGSPIDAAEGIALAAVNPQRGRDLDYRRDFAVRALPIIAVPTTAGSGAETNAFGVITDLQARRKFYVGHASTMPAAAILDPDLTIGLPPAATARHRDGCAHARDRGAPRHGAAASRARGRRGSRDRLRADRARRAG